MPRFSKGTTDHDNDGRMGGSMKGDATMAKAKKAKAAPKEPSMDPQSGMAPGKDAKAAKADTEAMFAEADAKGDPSEDERVGQQVRGY